MIKNIVIDQAWNVTKLQQEMKLIGVDPRGIELMTDKFRHFVVKLSGLSFRQAAIIKQEMLARGADAAVSWKVCSWDQSKQEEEFTVLLGGTWRQLEQFCDKLALQPFRLAELGQKFREALYNYINNQASLNLQGKVYDLSARSLVMGIINLTPDSFSQDGLSENSHPVEAALKQARQMIADGADILDIGAESTRPGSTIVPAEAELSRLLPVLRELVPAVSVPISVDTYKPEVAAACLELGVKIINDIWGLRCPDDPERRMAKVIANSDATVVIMHNRLESGSGNIVLEVINWLSEAMELAVKHGISPERIILDPGIGFGKTHQENLQLLQNLDQLKVLGRPILLGTSRKSVIGKALDLPVAERLEGTIATNIWGMIKGAQILRVHDVKAISRAIKMVDVIKHC